MSAHIPLNYCVDLCEIDQQSYHCYGNYHYRGHEYLNLLLHLRVLKQLHNGISGLLKLVKLLYHSLLRSIMSKYVCVIRAVCAWEVCRSVMIMKTQ